MALRICAGPLQIAPPPDPDKMAVYLPQFNSCTVRPAGVLLLLLLLQHQSVPSSN